MLSLRKQAQRKEVIMRRELRTKVDLLAKYPAAVKEAILTAESDEELLDVLGTVVSNTRMVSEQRRLAQ